MKKILLNVMALFVLASVIVLGCFKNAYSPDNILRKAIKQNQILGEDYILCQRARTTGFDWIVIMDENGNIEHELCNVTGTNPFSEYNFKHEFVMADNTYVFYIDNVEVVFSQETGESSKLYHAVEWDILYPVKREGIIDIFNSKNYIHLNDCK